MRLILAAMLAVCLAAGAWADDVRVAWDPPLVPGTTNVCPVAGYRLYIGSESGLYSVTVDVGNVLTSGVFTVSGVFPSYAAVAASNAQGRLSVLSEEAIYIPIPGVPRMRGYIVMIPDKEKD